MFASSRVVLASLLAGTLVSGSLPAWGGSAVERLSFGSTPSPMQIAGWDIDVRPSGVGLPDGHGTAAEGAKIFAMQCIGCHGQGAKGIAVPGRGSFPRLVGGIGTLTDDKPIKTVGSYWPYATGVFDYIRRAMPLTRPQSLTSDEVYALVAFILAKNGIIPDDAVMDAETLPAVKMPNRNGFITRVGEH